jgi:hypothetical protein
MSIGAVIAGPFDIAEGELAAKIDRVMEAGGGSSGASAIH